jgi:hypothetical protein
MNVSELIGYRIGLDFLKSIFCFNFEFLILERVILTVLLCCVLRALFNDAFGIDSISRRMGGRLIMNCKGFGRKRLWLDRSKIPTAQSM